jgi:amino acid adenylation domain-containing protein
VTTAAFLASLRDRQISLSIEGDRLRCSAPKGALTRELQSEIAQRKADILSCLRAGAAMPRRQAPPIRPVPRTRPLPLSFGQQRLWFLHQMDPASAAYNLQLSMPLPAVDVVLLERVLSEIVRRHETLRTTFDVADGQPVQIVHPTAPVRVAVFDLSPLAPDQRQAEAQRIKWETYTRPFDLIEGPVIRFVLLQLPEGRAELLIAQHHIVTDGWSVALLAEEFRAIAQAYVQGQPSPLPELPVQYADYASWQRAWLAGDVLEEHLAYWRRRLEGLTALEMPIDRPRPAVQSFAGALQAFVLSEPTSQALRKLSRDQNVTLYMTLLTAFQALLARYSGQTDIVVGTSNGNRRQIELEHLIGFFVNTQVIRTDFSGDPTFFDALRRVAGAALEAYDHEDVPFEKLVEDLQPRRDLSRSPLFDVLFIMQNTPLEVFVRQHGSARALPAGAIHAADLPVRKSPAKFDLTLSMGEAGDRIYASLEYSTDLFDDETITQLLGHFEILLEAVALGPERRLSSIPLLTAADRELVNRANATSEPLDDVCLHDLIAARLRITPDAVAVTSDLETLTYRTLDALGNRIARTLVDAGVGPGMRVAVCLDRTPRMVAALLGVLKAGAAYVPLDPEYPRERLAYMLEDSAAVAILTTKDVAPLLPASRTLAIDIEDGIQENADPFRAPASPSSPAYVIYTSGSTGRPKGVVVPHAAVVNFLSTMSRRPGMTDRDVMVAVTTLAFDIAGLELFLPLMAGGRVVIADRAETLDGARLSERLARDRATVMQATPATWRMLLDSGWRPTPALRMFCGGEAMPRALADALLAGGGELWNLYGPTETTIWSTAQRLEADGRPISIGSPVGNTTLYVLDGSGGQVATGIAGELHIGGAGVAHGYLNRPDLTAERFVPDPFGSRPGGRLYRTGDMVKRRRDGSLDYIGRTDHQIKLRGFRIELPEIEAVLAGMPSVAESIAMVHTGVSGDPALVAYVRPADGTTLDAGDLRAHLREMLPAYMVPAHIVPIDAWPRTPNGKIDRKALPKPAAEAGAQAAYVAPQNDAERKIAEIWRDLLKAERVGARDNFFDLGGHSLLIVTLQGRLAAVFDQPLRIVDLFRFPTVESLARHLTAESAPAAMLDGVQDRALRNREAARRRRVTREPIEMAGAARIVGADRPARAD